MLQLSDTLKYLINTVKKIGKVENFTRAKKF